LSLAMVEAMVSLPATMRAKHTRGRVVHPIGDQSV
jgi:hypothetical protein